MTLRDALKTQYHLLYLTLRKNLEGVTAEDSVVQPQPGGNCANWIVAHLVGVQNGVMGLAKTDPVWEDGRLEGLSDPIRSADDALEWDEMVSRLLASEDRLMTALDQLDDDDLDEEGFTDPFGNETTRGDFLNLLAFHQAYHAGQLGVSRRLVGLEGAIRAPEADEVAA